MPEMSPSSQELPAFARIRVIQMFGSIGLVVAPSTLDRLLAAYLRGRQSDVLPSRASLPEGEHAAFYFGRMDAVTTAAGWPVLGHFNTA
ncbi:hypothetical protein [Deinococcus hohokamensis]|uniref:Uncharacterized protein n=1 Tax=Deinococcus hohokamensis TaxID=309883 RepID=A0ABV9IFY2_9DEIO